MKHFGKLDVLVNAAAGNFLASAEDLSPNGFKTGNTLFLLVQSCPSRDTSLIYFVCNLLSCSDGY